MLRESVMSQCDCTTSQYLLPLEVALAQLLECMPDPLVSEPVELHQALGRVLAMDQHALLDVPAWDNSAMDGYALRASDLPAAGGWLPVLGRVAAGDQADLLAPQTAVRIFTGAPLPPGADSVVPQEQCRVEGGQVLLPALTPGQHVRRQAEELRRGDLLVPKGQRLRAQDIGLLASHGLARIPAYRRLRVALVSSGDELREPGQPVAGGQIYDANRYTLLSLLQGWGMEVIDGGCLADDLALTRNRLAELAGQADVLLSSGGVSVGEEDHLKLAVQDLGTLQLWRLAIQPGKPLAFGEVAGTPWIGLPGNPVAVLVTAVMVARPWLLKAQGCLTDDPMPYLLPAGFDWPKARPRRQFLRGRRESCATGQQALLHENQGSAMLSAACWAAGLVEIEPERTLKQGDLVRYWPFEQLLV